MMILIFILGLIVGSFLNVVIYRLHAGGSMLLSRSACPACHHPLSSFDLVPLLSFLFLRGRCRYCHKKISWQYPLVELATALTFVLLAQNYGLRITDYGFYFQLVLASFLIVIAVYDLKYYLILDKVVWPAIVIAIIYNIFFGHLLSGIYAGVGLASFFLLQYLVSRGRWIGFGDVKLGFLLGSILGWPVILVCAALAYFSGAVVGIALIASGKKQFSSHLPLGTFLGFSAIMSMLWGQSMAIWYLRLIGL